MITAGRHVEVLQRRLPSGIGRGVKQAVKGYRSLTSGLRLLPDFIIIGARRCGTTSLYHYLTQHPCVMPALKKEIFYFTDYFQNGLDWYRGHFPTRIEKRFRRMRRGGNVITGEATPSYLYDPLVARRIHEMNPNMKILVILRNPVDAIYSAYYLGLKHRTYTAQEVQFENCILEDLERAANRRHYGSASISVAEKRGLISHGIYIEHLKPWFDLFPDEQIKVLITEEFFPSPDEGFQEVLSFLGVPPCGLKAYQKLNTLNYPDMDPLIRSQLADFFAPYNRRLESFLSIETGWGERRSRASSHL
jgi:hypothetical protein